MTIKELKNRLKEIAVEAKAAETSGDDAKLDKLIEEANTINDKIERAQKLAEITQNATAAEESEGEQQESTPESLAEKRGKKLKNGETVRMNKTIVTPKAAISTTTIAMPHHTAEDVRDTFNDVSSLIDAVKIVPLDGGESYQRGFVKSYGEGDYTTEGSDAATAEPTFDYVDINKTYITAYAEEPNAIRKLAPAAYDAVISNSTSRAVRKKLSKQILVGSGETGSIVGIFNAPAKVIDPTTDMEVTAITGTTLDDIIYSYGGEEDVEGFAVLFSTKPTSRLLQSSVQMTARRFTILRTTVIPVQLTAFRSSSTQLVKLFRHPEQPRASIAWHTIRSLTMNLLFFLTWMCQSQMSTNLNQDRLHTRLKCMWAVIRHHTTALFV